jgi:hypothetical protein
MLKNPNNLQVRADRRQLGVRWDDQLDYEMIGNKVHNSFRGAMTRYGMEKVEIDRVIDDINCDRDVTIIRSGHHIQFRSF